MSESLTLCVSTIDGEYRLGTVISRSGRSMVCETECGDDAVAAVIRIEERVADSEDPLRRWRNAIDLAHPNLLKIYAAGASVLNDVPVTYAVMERADESLEGVLSTRPLTEEETREMVVSAAAALRYLHEKGYAHSRLGPSNVLAVGEQVKLSSHGVTRMADGGSPAEDMKALGGLIVQALALTPQLPNGNGDSRVDVPEEIPEPFREVAQHCLDPDPARRWTAGQVLAMLTTRQGERPLPTPAVEAPGDAEGKEETRDWSSTSDNNKESSTKGLPKWIYAALAVLVLIVFVVADLRKKSSVENTRIPAAVAEQAPLADVSTPGTQPEPESFSTEKPTPAVESAPTVGHANERKADGWSVIVAAYGTREPAEKRMRELARKWPGFNLSVFQPQTGNTHFIVVLGQNLSEDGAEALRKRAVAAGLPRDTYIKRLM